MLIIVDLYRLFIFVIDIHWLDYFFFFKSTNSLKLNLTDNQCLFYLASNYGKRLSSYVNHFAKGPLDFSF